MELLEVLILSLVGTVITADIFIINTKNRVSVHDPFVSKLELDKAGNPALKGSPADGILREIAEVIKREAINKI